MSETERPSGANDAELISRVRGGDVDAYGELFSRHVDAATRLARTLAGAADADDLVSEAFVKVLNVLLGGGGPDIAFRAYLLTAVRRLHVDKIRSTRRATPTDDLTPYDPGVPFRDTVITGFEGGAAARAFASLPERWQMVLWHLEVEGQKPAEVAPLLGMSANSVSALAYRAREGLRQAFLQMHTADLVEDNCRWTHDKIGAYVRKGLSRRDHDKVERHLDECRRCTAIYLELAELNTSLAAVIGPLVLGGAAAAYLAGGAVGATGLVGLGALLGRARDLVVGNSQAAIAVGATAGLAAVATTGFLVMQHHPGHGTLAVSDPALSGRPSDAPAPISPAHRRAVHRVQPQRPAATRTTGAHPVALVSPRGTPTTAPARAKGTATATPSAARVTRQVSGPTTPGPTTAPTTHAPDTGRGTGPSTGPGAPGTPRPTGSPSAPAPPPPASADVALQVSDPLGATSLGALVSDAAGTSGFLVRVAGIPTGATVRLTVESNATVRLDVGGLRGCTVHRATVTCVVTPQTGQMAWVFNRPLQSLRVSMKASPATDGSKTYDDPNPSNNSFMLSNKGSQGLPAGGPGGRG